MKNICVYLGASSGANVSYQNAVIELAEAIAHQNMTLIYGGSSLGLMGLLANTVKRHGGKAVGVITEYLLDKEHPLKNLDTLHIVNSMAERKKLLQSMADVFVVMPGGLGTLEEAIETWNAIKIGEINKKIGFLNIDNYFDKLFEFVNHCAEQEFLPQNKSNIPIISNNVNELLDELIEEREVII